MALRVVEVNNYEFYVFNKINKLGRYVEVSTKALQNKHGEIYAVAMVLRGVNTRNLKNDKVEQNLTKVSKQKEHLEQFFGWIST